MCESSTLDSGEFSNINGYLYIYALKKPKVKVELYVSKVLKFSFSLKKIKFTEQTVAF